MARRKKSLADVEAQGLRVMNLARELNYRDTDYGRRNMPWGVKDRFYHRALPAYNSVKSKVASRGLANG